MEKLCEVYWGSHGCRYGQGHEGQCECDCCACVQHPDAGDGVLCVAKPPYYGADTNFYGDDAARRGLQLVD